MMLLWRCCYLFNLGCSQGMTKATPSVLDYEVYGVVTRASVAKLWPFRWHQQPWNVRFIPGHYIIHIYIYTYLPYIYACMLCFVMFCFVMLYFVMLCFVCVHVYVYIYICIYTFPDAYMYPGCPVFFARNHPWNHACRGQWTCTTVVLATSSWHFDDCRSIQRSCNLDQRAWVADPQSGRCSNSTHGTLPTQNLDVMSNENIYKLNMYIYRWY